MIRNIVLTLLAFLLAGCVDSDPISDVGKSRLPDYGQLVRDTLTAEFVTYQQSEKVTSALSPRLQLGNVNGFSARLLIKFETLAFDSVVVNSVPYFLDSVIVNLKSIAHIGDNIQPFNAKVYLVTEEWQGNVNADENWFYQDNIDLEELTTFEVNEADSFTYNIPLPDTVMDVWKDTTGGNNNQGIFIDYEDAMYIKEFGSENSNSEPKIIYVYKNEFADSTVKDTINAFIDASVFEYDAAFSLGPDSLIYICSGVPYRSFVVFNFDSIPENVVFSKADFIFKNDQDYILSSDNRTQSSYIRTVTTPIENLPAYSVDSTFTSNIFYSVLLQEQDDIFLRSQSTSTGEAGQYFIQSIINKEVNYKSFLLHYYEEGYGVSVYAIKGINNISYNNRPKLILEYYILPEPRI